MTVWLMTIDEQREREWAGEMVRKVDRVDTK
jgi:hypothetical protein